MKRILILHTGGTIGMVPSPKSSGPSLLTKKLHSHFLDLVPELKQLAQIETLVLDNIDSSNVTPAHWAKWIKSLKTHYSKFDGFVMTHGTDTMAYTGAALSFALRHLDKPLVLTGSQRPLAHIRTDGRENLINAVELACTGPKEVTLCFGNELLRANRVTKVSATDYVAFSSFNFPLLAKIGAKIEKNWTLLPSKEKAPTGKPLWKSDFDERVFCFKIFPGISSHILNATISYEKCLGVVLEAYGSGNVPSFDLSVLEMIELAEKLGKPVMIVSQCPHGQIDLEMYEVGMKAKAAGAISAGDMTPEASVVKLMHGLGLGLRGKKLKTYLLQNICGERS